jgi:hypothetical protein
MTNFIALGDGMAPLAVGAGLGLAVAYALYAPRYQNEMVDSKNRYLGTGWKNKYTYFGTIAAAGILGMAGIRMFLRSRQGLSGFRASSFSDWKEKAQQKAMEVAEEAAKRANLEDRANQFIDQQLTRIG